MSTFTLLLHDINQQYSYDKVVSFVGRDGSGSFGIQAGHETFVTCLQPGLARFRMAENRWQYVAQPGAVILFQDNQLQLSASQLLLSDDYGSILSQMDSQWHELDQQLGSTKRNIAQVEQALARKILEMNRRGENL